MMILVINPGSTSTKMAVFEDEKPILLRTINHSAEELASFEDVLEQKDFRRIFPSTSMPSSDEADW